MTFLLNNATKPKSVSYLLPYAYATIKGGTLEHLHQCALLRSMQYKFYTWKKFRISFKNFNQLQLIGSKKFYLSWVALSFPAIEAQIHSSYRALGLHSILRLAQWEDSGSWFSVNITIRNYRRRNLWRREVGSFDWEFHIFLQRKGLSFSLFFKVSKNFQMPIRLPLSSWTLLLHLEMVSFSFLCLDAVKDKNTHETWSIPNVYRRT